MRFALLLGSLLLAISPAGAQVFPVPGPGHLPWAAGGGGGWSGDLGVLSSYSAQIPVIDPVTWPAALRTSSAGWDVVTIGGSGSDYVVDCASTGNTADASAIASAISTECPSTDCGGKWFQVAPSCHVDLGQNWSVRRSNIRISGAGMDSSYIDCNNVAGDNGSVAGANNDGNDYLPTNSGCMTVGTWGQGSSPAFSCTWTAGGAQLATALTVTGCGGTPAAGNFVAVIGNDSSGTQQIWHTRATSYSGGTLTIDEGLPVALSPSSVQVYTAAEWVSNVMIDGLTVGFPLAKRGTCSNTTCRNAGSNADVASIFFHGVGYLVIDGVRMKGYVQSATNPRNTIHAVIHSEIAEGLRTYGANTNSGSLSVPENGRIIDYDNVWATAAPRMHGWDGTGDFSYSGFNFQKSQVVAAAGWSGNHCYKALAADPNYPDATASAEGERGSFPHGPTGANPGGMVIEAYDTVCGFSEDRGGIYGPNWVFLRNQSYRDEVADSGALSGAFKTYATAGFDWLGALVAGNRFGRLESGSHRLINWTGLYNVTETATHNVPSGTGTTWGATNVSSTTGPHPSFGSVNVPPSVAFKSTPDWWCVESGPFSFEWRHGFGQCADLYSSGGPPQTSGSPDGFCDSDGSTSRHMTPAARRALGLSCTNP